MTIPDRIEKQILLKAPLERVWRAISDAQEFGTWFGMEFEKPFVVGERISGKIRPTRVDPEVAKLQAPHEGKACSITVECIEPQRRFAFRWNPSSAEPQRDGSVEPTTLIEFELAPTDSGTQLKITESGFEGLPLERRAAAFSSNDQGWEIQTQLIAKFLQRDAA